jgi:hypothetical protein
MSYGGIAWLSYALNSIEEGAGNVGGAKAGSWHGEFQGETEFVFRCPIRIEPIR